MTSHQFVATRLPADEADARIAIAVQIERDFSQSIAEASRLVEVVREQARRAEEIARGEVDLREAERRAAAAEETAREIERQRLDAAAKAAARLIHDAGRVREEFEALTPWLTDFLREAVTRLVGELGSSEVLSRLVMQGVAQLRDARGVTVLVPPEDMAAVEQAQADFPRRFAGVTDVRAAADLPPGTLAIEFAGGVLDASLTTQIDLLVGALERLE